MPLCNKRRMTFTYPLHTKYQEVFLHNSWWMMRSHDSIGAHLQTFTWQTCNLMHYAHQIAINTGLLWCQNNQLTFQHFIMRERESLQIRQVLKVTEWVRRVPQDKLALFDLSKLLFNGILHHTYKSKKLLAPCCQVNWSGTSIWHTADLTVHNFFFNHTKVNYNSTHLIVRRPTLM